MSKQNQNTEFNLDRTLSCGQCFRWTKNDDGVWSGFARGESLKLHETETAILYSSPLWRSYFDLELDYGAIRAQLSQLSPVLEKAASFSAGIRILNQEPWEALCSFMISQNNNIPRIRGIISRLCARYGEPLFAVPCTDDKSSADNQNGLPGEMYVFPRPEALAESNEAELRSVGCGFRAPYILDAARSVSSGFVPLEELKTLPLAEARECLMTIRGVGPKVADCTLLYGLHRLDSFPADVWIKRAMAELFPDKTPDFFGEYAGIAQQYIFHYMRCAAHS